MGLAESLPLRLFELFLLFEFFLHDPVMLRSQPEEQGSGFGWVWIVGLQGLAPGAFWEFQFFLDRKSVV